MITKKEEKILDLFRTLTASKLKEAEIANQKGKDIDSYLHDFNIISDIYYTVVDIIFEKES